ncbi:hypothetical protein IMZ48_43620 [Candidatus Bathyarchaeota archaeon]|nr:hypothetical protein [Candidatus Bathyarchaeota archaeon]
MNENTIYNGKLYNSASKIGHIQFLLLGYIRSSLNTSLKPRAGKVPMPTTCAWWKLISTALAVKFQRTLSTASTTYHVEVLQTSINPEMGEQVQFEFGDDDHIRLGIGKSGRPSYNCLEG